MNPTGLIAIGRAFAKAIKDKPKGVGYFVQANPFSMLLLPYFTMRQNGVTGQKEMGCLYQWKNISPQTDRFNIRSFPDAVAATCFFDFVAIRRDADPAGYDKEVMGEIARDSDRWRGKIKRIPDWYLFYIPNEVNSMTYCCPLFVSMDLPKGKFFLKEER